MYRPIICSSVRPQRRHILRGQINDPDLLLVYCSRSVASRLRFLADQQSHGFATDSGCMSQPVPSLQLTRCVYCNRSDLCAASVSEGAHSDPMLIPTGALPAAVAARVCAICGPLRRSLGPGSPRASASRSVGRPLPGRGGVPLQPSPSTRAL